MTPTEKLLLKELKAARRAIIKMKGECNQFEEGFALGKKALKRIDQVVHDIRAQVG